MEDNIVSSLINGGATFPPLNPPLEKGEDEESHLQWVSLTEATEGSHGATARYFFETDASSTVFLGVLNSLATTG